MVTIKDVAKHANVSPGTVSNVLTGKRLVADATRQRILETIEELGYQPNMLGRNLVNQRSETIGVVTHDVLSYGNALIASGIMQETNELGYSLMLTALHETDKEAANKVLSSLVNRQVDGIIWAVPEMGRNSPWIGEKQLPQLPPLMCIGSEPRPGFSMVALDNHGGGLKATQHLIEIGCNTVGLITGPLDWLLARQRRAGWLTALRSARLPTDKSLQVEGDWSAVSGEEGLYRLLAQRPDIDAVFACNDQMALGALRTAHLLGRQVPQDLAIIGFDNIPESAFFWPALSTVHHDLIEMGRTAARQLHRMIASKQRGEDVNSWMTIVLEPKLVIRESSQRRASAKHEMRTPQEASELAS